jgi:energy-coupling factor transporter ATP-binding protein EcfA2
MVMLRSFWARNFLSLRDVQVELGKLNVFVGPNASGKSNIVKAFALLGAHAQEGPFLKGLEKAHFLLFGFDRTSKAEVGVEAEVVGGKRADFVVRLGAKGYEEEARLEGKRLLYHEGSNSSFDYLDASGTVRKGFVHEERPYYDAGYVYRSALSVLPPDSHPALAELVGLLRGVVVLSPSPSRIRGLVPLSAKGLGYEGEGLAGQLLYMYLKDIKTFKLVEEAVKNLVPRVQKLVPDIALVGGEYYAKLEVDEEGLGHASLSNVSDGTLRIIALATALYGGTRVVLVEEPENCVHPGLLEALVDAMRNAPPQVIVTTHSPYLLDHVEPEEVYVVGRTGLETRVRKLSETREAEAVKRFLREGGTLGEAWYAGMFGEET